jgi:hypothetical protein
VLDPGLCARRGYGIEVIATAAAVALKTPWPPAPITGIAASANKQAPAGQTIHPARYGRGRLKDQGEPPRHCHGK